MEEKEVGVPEEIEALIKFYNEAYSNPKTRRKLLEIAQLMGYEVNEDEIEPPEIKEAVEPVKQEVEKIKEKMRQEEARKTLDAYYSILRKYNLPASEENVKRIFSYASQSGIGITSIAGFEKVVKDYVSNIIAVEPSHGKPAPPKISKEDVFKRYQEGGVSALKEDIMGYINML